MYSMYCILYLSHPLTISLFKVHINRCLNKQRQKIVYWQFKWEFFMLTACVLLNGFSSCLRSNLRHAEIFISVYSWCPIEIFQQAPHLKKLLNESTSLESRVRKTERWYCNTGWKCNANTISLVTLRGRDDSAVQHEFQVLHLVVV